MTDVSVAACGTYSPEICRAALLEALEPFGGLDWVAPGMRIGIKANLVSFLKPEAAGTTHPVLLAELTGLLRERGAAVVVGDSPGGLYQHAYVNRIYAATGMRQVEAAGAELNQDYSQRTAEFPAAVQAKQFQYTAWLDGCDAVINFCKLKTHGMMGMSNAAKNLFGVIPGTIKPEYHYRYPQPLDFANMLVDLNEYVQPRLSICDAVVGMEGNGPTGGTPRAIGCILAAENPHKLDLAAARLIGIDAMSVPTLRAAADRGLTPERPEELELTGDLTPFCISDYKLLSNNTGIRLDMGFAGPMNKLLGRFVQSALASVPKVERKTCVGCGECGRICPAKAIVMEQKLPVIDRKACIRCFCCQEFCPKSAMVVHRPLIARVLNHN